MDRTPPDAQIGEALARLRDRITVPAIDTAREQALLAAFDRPSTPVRTSARRPIQIVGVAAAALIAAAVGLDWLVVSDRRRVTPSQADVTPPRPPDGFVLWPGAAAWPPLESGTLIRVELPLAALPALGLEPPTSTQDRVEAEIVFGQDGLARAVRLVQLP